MNFQKLGNSDLLISRIGLGCMGMSEFYGPHDDAVSVAAIDRALDLGLNFLDTADAYGRGQNEELVGQAIKDRRDEIVLATKFGIVREGEERSINGSPAYVKTAREASLRRLGIDTIDLYYLHRVDPQTPIEETVGAMADLVQAGKVRYIGLSEVASGTLRRAMAIHPVTALQSEYSLWSRDPEDDVFATCRELGVGLVAYSPLGRGFLTGSVTRFEDFTADDWRRTNPRFQGDNFEANLALVEKIKRLAADKGCTPAQLALAWLLAQGDDVFPIRHAPQGASRGERRCLKRQAEPRGAHRHQPHRAQKSGGRYALLGRRHAPGQPLADRRSGHRRSPISSHSTISFNSSNHTMTDSETP
mgnify:CR=1 FL=1|tara:strand:+ start:29660 stop:30739 length:1080 start_codon:yes stop_codon:yes gene_type:complete